MDTLTLTAKTPGTANFWSDGKVTSKIPLLVTYAVDNSPVTNVNVTALELRDAADQPVAGASAISKVAALGANGNIDVDVASLSEDVKKLFLQTKGNDSGNLAVTCKVLDEVSWKADPPVVTKPGSITLTAIIAKQGTPADGVPLRWQPADMKFRPFFPAGPVSKTTTAADPTSYQTVLEVTPDLVTKFIGQSIDVQLIVGDPMYGMTIKNSIPILAPLKAPELAFAKTSVIDDSLLDAFITSGVPFRIPEIADASAGDYVALTGKTDVSPAVIMGGVVLSEKDKNVGLPFLMFVSVENAAFSMNGPLTVTYTVSYAALKQENTSEELNLTVQLRNPLGPDGPTSKELTPVDTRQYTYSKDDYDAGTTLEVTVNFNGDLQPRPGDIIRPVLKLTGYTPANLNWTKRLELKPYEIQQQDIDAGALFTFPDKATQRDGFTSDLLAGIDGSNGDLFFDYKKPGADYVRSPTRAIIVDTVQAHSGDELSARLDRSSEDSKNT